MVLMPTTSPAALSKGPPELPGARRASVRMMGMRPRRPRVCALPSWLTTPKLAALQVYQLAIPAPKRPAEPFDFAARRGEELFNGKAGCARCHTPPLFTEPGWNAHTPADVCIDSFQADRSPDKVYRTAPLAGLFSHQKGGFYHDGRFRTLSEVVNHYDGCMNLQLSDDEKEDLVKYLLTL